MTTAPQAFRGDVSPSSERISAALDRALGRDDAATTRAFDRVIAAVDASHYLLTPSAVVTPRDAREVADLLAYASAAGEQVTFRSGGTSLSGQASSDGILADVRTGFRSIEIEDEGRIARVGPGATVRQVNARLLRHGRKLGPDPASEIACTIGGVVANNSSGMACGTEQNTYRTLRSATIVLASGTVVDTAAPGAEAALEKAEPALFATLHALRARVMADDALVAEIRRQYSIKNTMGYGLNSLVDHDTAVQMLAHLMIGSEGTLGFVAEAVFDTVPLHRHAATALLLFDSLRAATDALVDLVATHPATIELLDAASLRAAQIDPASRAVLPAVEFTTHCALLVEYQASSPDALAQLTDAGTALFARLPLIGSSELSDDAQARAGLWHIRKGLYATVAGARPSGTTALLEDIAVPVERLSDTCEGLVALFAKHAYSDAVIFGHAKDGNIHFLVNEDFDDAASLERYRQFTDEMIDLVLGFGGTLKAEHGTGRIMAPFVERQFGPDLYAVMREIKRAFDPAGILNPDTILTDDAELHLRDLKSTPSVEVEVDRCVECGYCEPVCPSKDLTTTPRQRIAVRRALADAEARGDRALVAELTKAQDHEVLDTCAVDGMCQTACPVLINTGDLVRRLRGEQVGGLPKAVWNLAARDWEPVTRVASAALTAVSKVPAAAVKGPNVLARKLLGADTVPMWTPDLPAGGPKRRGGDAGAPGTPTAVFFAACVGSMFGPAPAASATPRTSPTATTPQTPPAPDAPRTSSSADAPRTSIAGGEATGVETGRAERASARADEAASPAPASPAPATSITPSPAADPVTPAPAAATPATATPQTPPATTTPQTSIAGGEATGVETGRAERASARADEATAPAPGPTAPDPTPSAPTTPDHTAPTPADPAAGAAGAFLSLAEKAGVALVRPDDIGSLCCGTPWKSKGIQPGYDDMIGRTVASLWAASDEGRLPIVCDNSSCTEGLVHAVEAAIATDPRYADMRIVDAVDFAAESILPRIEVTQTVSRMAVHPTCSSTRAGSNANLLLLADAVADEAVVPDDWGCCAFAGDRGMLHPELTASATSREADEVASGAFDEHVSCNRTCEIGMTRATGSPYRHVLEVLDRVSIPAAAYEGAS